MIPRVVLGPGTAVLAVLNTDKDEIFYEKLAEAIQKVAIADSVIGNISAAGKNFLKTE